MSLDRSCAGRPLRGLLLSALVLSAFVALAAAAVKGEGPLVTSDVVQFLQAGISEHTMLTELQSRGFKEALTTDRESTLREAGASETLIVAIRRAAPPISPPAGSASGSSGGGYPGTHGPTFSATARTVRVPVAVVDKSGQPVLNLQATDFKISDQGRPQPVTLFSRERRALRIALALDVSRSMRDKINEVEASLRYFIDLLEPADEILVIAFNDHLEVLQDFTSDRDQLRQVLDMLEPDGGTALYDAGAEAIRRVAPGPAESKAVVLVTDGVDTASRTSFKELLELARRTEVPVFSIGLDAALERPHPGGHGMHVGIPGLGGGHRGPGSGGGGGGGQGGSVMYGPPRKGFDAGPLQELAEETGGLTVIVKDLGHYSVDSEERSGNQLKAGVESIAMSLRHRYLLGYDPPELKPGWRTIHIDIDRPGATGRARKGYYAGA